MIRLVTPPRPQPETVPAPAVWWRNELPGGSGSRHVWAWVNATTTAAGWTGPLGGVGFVPSTATGCS